jgi:hypothetical protein
MHRVIATPERVHHNMHMFLISLSLRKAAPTLNPVLTATIVTTIIAIQRKLIPTKYKGGKAGRKRWTPDQKERLLSLSEAILPVVTADWMNIS